MSAISTHPSVSTSTTSLDLSRGKCPGYINTKTYGTSFYSRGPVGHLGSFLAAQRTITSLDLSWNSLCAIEGNMLMHDHLNASRITSLDLSHNFLQGTGNYAGQGNIDDFNMKVFESHKTLTSLNLSNNGLHGGGKSVLDLSSGKFIRSPGSVMAEIVKMNTVLTTLDLSNNQLGVEEIAAIAEALKENYTLQALHLEGNPGYNSADISTINDLLLRNRELQTSSLQEHCERLVIQETFNSLPVDIKGLVYLRIWQEFGSPMGDDQFGEKNVFSDWGIFMRVTKELGIDLRAEVVKRNQSQVDGIQTLFHKSFPKP